MEAPANLRIAPRPRLAPFAAPASLAFQDSGWVLVDSDSFKAYLPVGKACVIRYDNVGDTLQVTIPQVELTSQARAAIAYAPDWLSLDLVDAFRRMDSSHQDLYANLILGTADPIVDEVAFVVAHTAPEVLQSPFFYPGIITENAQEVYAHDAYLDYADIVDYGSAAAGGDYYSTIVYRTAAAGETLQVELPRERYYWDIVHPKITDESPTYIDPATGYAAAPPLGQFWREFLFSYADSGFAVLRDQLAGCKTLWEGNVDSRTNGAIGILTQWILDVMDFGSGSERPIQPVRIYRLHLGRCGEHADITAAAARAALIPTNSASAMDNDHTWNEFWDRRWIHWEPVNVYVDSPWHYETWGWQFLGAFDWRGDDWVWTVTERYTPVCSLSVAVTDSGGYPVDGAQVTIARRTGTVSYIASTWASTGSDGTCQFLLGDGQDVYARIDSDLGTIPSGPLYKLVVSNTVAGQHYYWNKILPNRRPRVPAIPSTPPGGPGNDYRIRVVWDVDGEYCYGPNRIDKNTFSDYMADGAVEFFMCDADNYTAYAAGDSFHAYDVAEDAPSGNVAFDVPTDASYYAILSNQEHVVDSQVVRGRVELYHLGEAGVAEGGAGEVGEAGARLSLGPAVPNPAMSEAAMRFALPQAGRIDLAVYDISGRRLKTLATGETTAGEHRVIWDGTDSRGTHVAPGVYLCRLVTPEGTRCHKMTFVR